MKSFTLNLSPVFCILLLVLTQCKNNDDPKINASLTINISAIAGKPTANAEVNLYSSQGDWLLKQNQIGSSMITDENGNVTFSNLESKIYYWGAQESCSNNFNEMHATSTPLVSGINLAYGVISPTATLTISNDADTSPGPYMVYIDGISVGILNIGESYTLLNAPARPYFIEGIQQNATTDPIISKIDVSLFCGYAFSTSL